MVPFQTVVLYLICDFLNETFRFTPTNTGICDRFTVNPLSNFLTTVFQIGLDHKSLYHRAYLGAMAAGIENILANSRLLIVFLGGVRMV